VARRFYQRIGPLLGSAGSVSAAGDLRFPEVEGERTLMVRLINWYLGKPHVAAHRDPAVAAAVQRVVNMLAAPASVMPPPSHSVCFAATCPLARASDQKRSVSWA